MKIAQLTSVHQRHDIRVFHKMSASFVKHNVDVYLVVADGLGDAVDQGVKILDVGKKEGNRLLRVLRSTSSVFRKAIKLDADLYQFHDPELIPVGVMLKLFRKRVIFDMHEHTAKQILIKDWIGSKFSRIIVSKLFYLFQIICIKFFDAVLVPQLCMKNEFIKYNKNTHLIANFPSRSSIGFDIDNNIFDGTDIKLLYSGLVSEARGIYNMLNLLAKLGSQYSLTIAGNMDDELLNKVKKHDQWERVNYLGYISQKELDEVYSEHDVGLILFNNVGQYYMSYSLKLFEYMRSGMVVVMPDFGDWPAFNAEFDVGYNVCTSNPESILDCLNSLSANAIESFSNRNKLLTQSKFNWDQEELNLLVVYKNIYTKK